MKHNQRDNSTACRRPHRHDWSSTLALVAMMAATLLLVGCPEEIEEQELDPADADEEAELDLEYDASQGFGEDESYSRPAYAQQRNPFRPDTDVLSVGDEQEEEIDDERDREPIEQYSLDSLELVSTISQTAVPRAMFVDPTSLGHFVNENDRIGSEGAVVRDIRQHEVDVEDSDGIHTIALREADSTPSASRDGDLTEEEREALRQIVEQERESGGDDGADEQLEDIDERFPGLRPPDDQ